MDVTLIWAEFDAIENDALILYIKEKLCILSGLITHIKEYALTISHCFLKFTDTHLAYSDIPDDEANVYKYSVGIIKLY